ncbi:transcription factor domain-containing protein [Aspergillus stella-maris]|uniref:transcription factor domain-containing protein n=1 Tax=Aspergillus stella-maris TaxID=1810926 RepID=UPI003CCD013C
MAGDSSGSGNETGSKPRHRASVACMACRERRTRCVVQSGQSSCTQCQENGQECVIKNDDQRRKPVSKAYVSQLQEQIQQLQSALQQRDEEAQKQDISNLDPAILGGNNAPSPDPPALSVATPPTPEPIYLKPVKHAASPVRFDINKPSMAHRLLSARGHVSFDQLAGRQRYFGPTTNCHIYLDISSESEESRRQAIEQQRRTQRVLSALSQTAHDYLMQLFWTHYNSVIRVVHQEAFEAGKDAGGGPYYSGFLHICILAAGYRFADKQRPDMVRITLPGRESLLHREAKYMLDYEMERPGGLPSIAALLLLGDLEVGCGRDNAGWLYSGMAYRLCFDVGLHLDRSGTGLSQSDLEIGRMTLWACVIFDRYWALFLGRPTALKPDDLEIYELSQQFDRLGTSNPGSEKTLELQIYQSLFELMELGGKITSMMRNTSSRSADLDRSLYLRMASLDSELEKWYARLPQPTKYNAENARTAPPPFFLLHQQYYSTMVMLHRPFAGYEDILDPHGERKGEDGDSPPAQKHISALSHATCTHCAGRIAQIFWQQRKRFDTRKIFVTGLQHAGNAATALVAAIASSTNLAANDRSMRYLECLTAVLDDMSEAYLPAEQMSTIFKAIIEELKELQPALQSSNSIPARRGSSAESDGDPGPSPPKRGQSTRARTNSHAMQSMSWPGEPTVMPTILPSPPLTYQSTSGKPAIPRGPEHNSLVADSNMGNIDDSWSIFSAPDRFSIGNVMAGQGSPSAFCSPWPSTETPSLFRLANDATVEIGGINNDFMHLVEDHNTTDHGQGLGGNQPIALPSTDAADETGLSLKPTHPTDTGSHSRIRGHRVGKRKSVSGRSDNIWTEIIS